MVQQPLLKSSGYCSSQVAKQKCLKRQIFYQRVIDYFYLSERDILTDPIAALGNSLINKELPLIGIISQLPTFIKLSSGNAIAKIKRSHMVGVVVYKITTIRKIRKYSF